MAWRIDPATGRSRPAPAMRSHAMNKTVVIAGTLALALSACSRAENDPAASASPDPELVTPAASAVLDASVPAALQGRFGLVPADCGPETGGNKGLIQVSANDIRFFESVARIGTVQERTDTRLKAVFAFSGEGMEWNRTVTMDTPDGGKTVLFDESGEDAPTGPRTYTRCG